jgi:hypothetical protein
MERVCTSGNCRHEAQATLTYDYEELIAVIGPLSPEKEPLAHDLCRKHALSFVAPVGWQVLRHLELTND